MRTFVTDAAPGDFETLAGVKWRKPTPECLVRFGTWQGAMVGIEACGKLWAVHVDTEACEEVLTSFLVGHVVYGADVWQAITGRGVPHIGGCEVAELVDGAAAVEVDAEGTAMPIVRSVAKAKLAAKLGVAVPEEPIEEEEPWSPKVEP